MQIKSRAQGNLIVHHALHSATDYRVTKTSAKETYTVFVGVPGATTYCFDYHGPSDTWRLGSVNTYGNYTGVYGEGCDASGFVVRLPELVGKLDGMLALGKSADGRTFYIFH